MNKERSGPKEKKEETREEKGRRSRWGVGGVGKEMTQWVKVWIGFRGWGALWAYLPLVLRGEDK